MGAIGVTEVIIILLLLVVLILPIIALVNILRNKFKNNDKLVWVVIVILIPLIGSILYFALGERSKSE